MPKEPSYNTEELINFLKKEENRTLDDNGKAYPPSHPIWQKISADSAVGKLSAKHAHTIINNDRLHIQKDLLKIFNIIPEEESSDEESDLDTSFVDPNKPIDKLLKVFLSAECWRTIEPTQREYNKGKLVLKLKGGWTDVITRKYIEQYRHHKCVLSFKKHDVSDNSSASQYLKFQGHCTECQATFIGFVRDKPRINSDVIVRIKFLNYVEANHTGNKKRRLQSNNRILAQTEMIENKKTAVGFQRQLARELKCFGDDNLSIIPNASTLWRAKEEGLRKRYNLKFKSCTDNLYHLAKEGSLASTIKVVNVLPFTTMYWTKEQKIIYNERIKSDENSCLAFDASGGFCSAECNDEASIFLYQCQLISKHGSIPVFQMITSKHTASNVRTFLQTIVDDGVKVPRTFVSDLGLALLIPAAAVFAKCLDLNDYLCKIYQIVHGENVTIPKCYLRLDASHFVKMIRRNKSLKNKSRLMITFYVRCMCLAYETSSFEKLEHLIESLLIIALSPTVGTDSKTGEKLESQKRIEFLENEIKGINEGEFDPKSDSEESSESSQQKDESDKREECEQIQNDSPWKTWAESLLKSASAVAQTMTNGLISGYQNEKFAEYLVKYLLRFVPLYTRLMNSYFHRPNMRESSSSLESEFRYIKQSFKGELPMNVDKFVVRHIEYIEGKLLLSSTSDDFPEGFARDSDNDITMSDSETFNESQGDTTSEPDASQEEHDRSRMNGESRSDIKSQFNASQKARSDKSSTSDAFNHNDDMENMDRTEDTEYEDSSIEIGRFKKDATKGNDEIDLEQSKKSFDMGEKDPTDKTKDMTDESKLQKSSPAVSTDSVEVDEMNVEEDSATNSGNGEKQEKDRVISTSGAETKKSKFNSHNITNQETTPVKGKKRVNSDSETTIPETLAPIKKQKLNVDKTLRSVENLLFTPKKTKRKLVEYSFSPEKSVTTDSESSDDENIYPEGDKQWRTIENWKGQGKKPGCSVAEKLISLQKTEDELKKPRKRSRSTFFDKCSEYDAVKHTSSFRIPIMQNGIRCPQIKLGKETYTLNNTCAFDTILQILMSSLANVPAYHSHLNGSENPTIKLALDIIQIQKIQACHYIKRLMILKDIAIFEKKKFTRTLYSINANSNTCDVADRIFSDIMSVTRITKCEKCNQENEKKSCLLNVNVEILVKGQFKTVQDAIDDTENVPISCKKCSQKKEVTNIYGPHVIIDTSVVSYEPYAMDTIQKTCKLPQIQRIITLNDKKYILTGVAHYKAGKSLNDGHYVAYTRSGDFWREFNDMTTKSKTEKKQIDIVPHLLFYVITEI